MGVLGVAARTTTTPRWAEWRYWGGAEPQEEPRV